MLVTMQFYSVEMYRKYINGKRTAIDLRVPVHFLKSYLYAIIMRRHEVTITELYYVIIVNSLHFKSHDARLWREVKRIT